MNNTLAPVVLFVYNRLTHTRQTVEALSRNTLADRTDLIVYCDGPGSDFDREAVEQVRSYVDSIKGFKSVRVIRRERNLGLAVSIIDGVSEVVNRYGTVIVLEDDLITGCHFLEYMNRALEVYVSHQKVMHISGWNYPMECNGINSTFLWRYMNCWGWATWADRWRYFEKDSDKLISEFSKQQIRKLNVDGAIDAWRQVQLNRKKRIDTWAIFWYCSIFKQQGLCLSPKYSLVENIGFDASGAHCTSYDPYKVYCCTQRIEVHMEPLKENKTALECVKKYLKFTRPSLLKRVYYRLKMEIVRRLRYRKKRRR